MDTYIVNPVEVRMRESDKGVIYQSIVAMGIRARQINDNIKYEIQDRMQDIVIDTSETETTNYDQIQISREFDVIPKPTFIAMKEISDGNLHFTLPEVKKEDEE
jgi:DNA-directed RNA polymerase subunit K/omega